MVSVTGRTTAAVEAVQSRGGFAARCGAEAPARRPKQYKAPSRSSGITTTTLSSFNWGGGYGVLPGRNTRNQLAEVLHQNVGESNTLTDNWARTAFSYDEHGNPEWSISTTGKDNITSGITKVVAQTVYEYEIASGTPTKVKYREGFADQFFRRYNYDADNRLVSVESSRDNVLWETDVSYAFYPHGALRRTMLGADSVQGIDYTYTIQGRLKAINHPSLDVQYDPGRDGNSISGTTNTTKFGKDAFGMSLGYFPGDFVHTSSPFHSGTGALSYTLNPGNQLYDGTTNSPLYDGTITTQSSFIRPPVAGVLPDMAARQFKELVGESYRYDRSYRLRSSYFGPYQYTAPDNQGKPKWYMDGDYESHYKYDANGNFTYLRRWGRIAGPPYNVLSVNKKMDEFGDYVYTAGTNRLESFTESSYMTPFYPDDIDGEYMQSGNYVYDASGRLTTDKQEGVKPKWDVYDMVVEVVNNNGPLSSGESTPSASSKKIRYRYNAGGQRVQRLVFNFNASNGDFETEPALVQSYVYGMGGELLGVYEQKYVSGILQAEAVLKEWPLYGAGRLGLAQPAGTAAHSSSLLEATDTYSRVVDKKRYELSDHLGNVRAVVSDLKLDDGNGSFLPDEKAYYNYYPYGMLHPNRSWEAESYRFGFNGVEKENDVTVTGGIAMADFRMYDARVGRWWGVDKIVKVHESPYAAFFNNPINVADPSGLNGERKNKGGGEAGPEVPEKKETQKKETQKKETQKKETQKKETQKKETQKKETQKKETQNVEKEKKNTNDQKAKTPNKKEPAPVPRPILPNGESWETQSIPSREGYLTTDITISIQSSLTNSQSVTATISVGTNIPIVTANNTATPTVTNIILTDTDSETDTQRTSTWDPVTDRRISELDTRLQTPAREFINAVEAELGIQLRITQGFRSLEEQNALYAQGRTTPGRRVTNARGGQSYHNYGLAFDVVIMRDGSPVWETLSPAIGAIGTRLGFEWGGNWRSFQDYPHFQMTFGQTIRELQGQTDR